MKMKLALHWLNGSNRTSDHQIEIINKLKDEFPKDHLIALEIGSAYGGGVEAIARLWGERGEAYGFDTFEGHPKDLAEDKTSLEATCMEAWYHESMLGREMLKYEYQTEELKKAGITNAHFIKGRINTNSFKDIQKAHFVMIDLDLIVSTKIAYEQIKDKVVKGGYLFLHDALPAEHLPLIHNYVYDYILKDGRWQLFREDRDGLLTILKRI